MRTAPIAVLGIVVAVLVGGYFAYDYLKEKPPPFLIKWLTKTEPPPPLPQGELAPLEVPEGFVATIYSRETPGARVMIRDPKGTLLVSLTKEGRVVALPDLDSDQQADEVVTVLEGLSQPHGLAVVCPDTGNTSADQDACVLYVAETGALKAYSYDADTFSAHLKETVAAFPVGSGHFTRTLLLHPDGRHLLASVGSSCNVCEESDERRATVMSIDLVTKEASIFASGLRNMVFMAFHPVTGELWGSDNGRDGIGDDIPPDELNIIRQGQHYGWPYCYGKKVYDSDFGEASAEFCDTTTASQVDLQAHSAALGLAFVPEEGWPADFRRDALVAFHGSWNRSQPTGYKVVRINLSSQGEAQGAPIDFVTGFLAPGANEDEAIGRPVGLLVEPNGVLYVSDDRAGAIYRIAQTLLE